MLGESISHGSHVDERIRSDHTSQIPSWRGIRAGVAAWQHSEEGSTLTDRMGLAGICLVFPEFQPLGAELQLLITLAHGIDHVYDEGDQYKRPFNQLPNLQNLNVLYDKFYNKYKDAPDELFTNTVGFLSQAATIERSNHEATPQGEEKVVKYRELINAIWVRMIASFGHQLLNPNNLPDTIGIEGKDLSNKELWGLYEGFIKGENLDALAEGKKTHLLYTWTMAVQEQFDHVYREPNRSKNLPSFTQRTDYYKNSAIKEGIDPLILSSIGLLVGGLLKSKNEVGKITRYLQRV
ncbi:MAG: hypothetical protein ABIO02_00540 [Patescibacteria group bacterium]